MKALSLLLTATLAVASFSVHARNNGEDRSRTMQPHQVEAKWHTECSGCHLAFPPGALPPASWEKIMGSLDKHFGADASLTPEDTKVITEFLVKHASNRWTANSAPLRITETQWFKSIHMSGEISPSVWKRASIKTPSNCLACHRTADRGVFDEDSVSIPH